MTTLAGLCSTLGLGVSGTVMNATLFGAEVSNPMLQLRWFLRTLIKTCPEDPKRGLWESWMRANEWFFLLSYTLSRMIIGPALLWVTVQAEGVPLAIKLGGIVLQAISAAWFIFILQYAHRHNFFGGRPKKHE